MNYPSIGRIVHYVEFSANLHCAAIITEVDDPDVGVIGLHIFFPARITKLASFLVPRREVEHIAHDEDKKLPGTWHWPEQIG